MTEPRRHWRHFRRRCAAEAAKHGYFGQLTSDRSGGYGCGTNLNEARPVNWSANVSLDDGTFLPSSGSSVSWSVASGPIASSVQRPGHGSECVSGYGGSVRGAAESLSATLAWRF